MITSFVEMVANLALEEGRLFLNVKTASKVMYFSLEATFCSYPNFGSRWRFPEANIANTTEFVSQLVL